MIARTESAAPENSLEVRKRLVEALRLDLVGPESDHALAHEQLPGWVRPSNWPGGFQNGLSSRRPAAAKSASDLAAWSIAGHSMKKGASTAGPSLPLGLCALVPKDTWMTSTGGASRMVPRMPVGGSCGSMSVARAVISPTWSCVASAVSRVASMRPHCLK